MISQLTTVTCAEGGEDVTNGVIAPCVGRGGVKATKNKDSILKKISGSYNQNLIIAGVLVAGYLIWKNLKNKTI
jgi:hypothetical protein